MHLKPRSRKSTSSLVIAILLVSFFLTPLFNLIPLASGASEGWWNTSWTYRKEIRLNKTEIAGTLQNFPVLIDITDNDLASNTQPDGDDIVFIEASTNTKLSHEIEYYDSNTGHLIGWVNVPYLSSTTDTILYIYYGNPTAENQQNPETVWDTNHKLVLHLNEETGTHYDSTANNNDGTSHGGVTQDVSGKIDGADTFDGINGHIEVPHSNTISGFSTAFTASFWIKIDDLTRRQVILNKYDTTGNQRSWFIEYRPFGTEIRFPSFFASADGVNFVDWFASFTPVAGEWYHVAIVWQRNTVPRFHINGQQVPTNNAGTISQIYNNVGAPLHIARCTYDATRYLKGSLDEIRISDVAQSANWVLTSYNNQHNPSAFYALGPEETYTGAPTISNESPQNDATGIYTNPELSILAIDMDDDPLTIIFKTNATGTWQEIKKYTNVPSGTYTVIPSTMNQLGTKYHWSASVTDGTNWTNKTYSFTTTTTILSPKWTTTGVPRASIGVVIADVTGDSREEVIHAGEGGVAVLDGTTGNIIWSRAIPGVTVSAQCEVTDLNNDGKLEIIVPIEYPAGLFVLHGNNGSTYWTITNLGGVLTPDPVIADIDGNGYKTIFVATMWTSSTNNDAKIVSISHDGKILNQAWSWHPCAGGLSIADTDGDGEFELYLGDRHSTYGDGNLGRGLRSLWASNLTVRWERPEMLCSSHRPILADVTGNGILDVIIGHHQGGLAVFDSRDGSIIRRTLNQPSNFPIHYQPSVYDLNGNLVIIMHDGEHSTTTDDIVIWNLVQWKEVARTYVGIGKYGPQVADVTGDGVKNIIFTTNTGIYIFDEALTLLAQITGLASRLMYAVVQDIDGDGYNEIVVASEAGRIYAFDTPARTPTPRPRSEVRFYSERRCGAQEYVPPPGRFEPIISNPSPSNEEIDVSIALSQLSFTLTDFQGDLMNYTVTTTPNIGSGSRTHVTSGRYSIDISGLEYGKTYSWTINVTDGLHSTTETYSFTTKAMPLWWNTNWQYRKAITIDPAQVSEDQTDFPVLVDLTDTDLIGKTQPNGDDIAFTDINSVKLSHEIESYDSSTGHLVAWVRIPFVSSTSFTTFYMYYDNPAAQNQEDPAAVWDTSYKLVLHLAETHECRMWSMIADSGLPHDTVVSHLITDPYSIKALSASNGDGWGIVWYDAADFEERRGTPRANTDPNYDLAVYELADSSATIGVAHVRAASSGTPTGIPDPHPFTRIKNGKTWSLAHNGYIDKPTLKTLINNMDPNYLNENPPNVGDWNVENSYVDSDLYMAYIMLCIEKSNWDVLTGLALVLNNVPSGSGNIILTDGTTIWAYANGQTLTYYYQSTPPTYSVVASQNPNPSQAGWTSMSVYNLVILTRKNAPILISDIRQFKLLADATFDASADSDALRANSASQDWFESRNVPPSTLLYLDETNVGGNTGKKAGFTASSSGNAYCTQEFGAPQTGTFSVQWDIYVDSILNIAETDRAAWMMIGDNYDTSTANYQTPNNPPAERFVYMAFFKSGGGTSGTMDLVAKTIAGDFNANTTIASDLNLKQWYTIKVIVDVAAKSYDIYVDGVFKAKFATDFARNSVTHISFAQWNDGAGAFYVDNVYAPAPISTHTLTVNAVGSGTVTKNPDMSTYAYGSSVTLTAAAGPGWSFAGWSGDYSGTANPATIIMDSDKEITATFVAEVYTLSINVVGSGMVEKSPDLATYNYGDEVILTANPNAGYEFVTWSGDLSGTANPAVITMTSSKTVTATFLAEDTQVCLDSSANGHIGMLYGEVTQGAAGVINGAYSFDGINDYVEFAHSNALTGYTEAFTASFWLKLDDVTRRQAILNKYDTAGNQRGWFIEFQTHATHGKVLDFFASQDGASFREWYASFNPTAGQWYYITVVWQSNTIPKFYINGVQVPTINTATLPSIYNNTGTPLYIGRSYTTGRYLRGSLDEIRISNPVRSAGYILTSYNNQKDPSSFYAVGTEQSLPAAPIISDPYPANGATNVPVSLPELSFNLLDYQNDPMNYTVKLDDAIIGTGTGVASGTHSVTVNGLKYATTYIWEVSVTDGTHLTTATYTFTTASYLQQFLVDSTFDASVDSADLRANAAEQDWYESRNHVPTLLYLDTTNVSGNTGKKAGFTASLTGNAYLTQEFSSPQTGIFTAEWDINIASILAGSDNGYKAGIMMIGDNYRTDGSYATPNYPPDERFVYMAFYKPGGGTTGTMSLIVINPRTTIATDLNLHQWYTIKVVVDVTADTYDIYVDGVWKAKVNANAAKTSVTHISFAQWNDGAGAFYVDNVYAYVEIEDVWTITASAGLGGSIDPSGAVTVINGADQTFTITPDAGYVIADVLVDGISVGAVTEYTFYGVSEDHTIEASFAAVTTYTIVASAGIGGDISPSGDVVVSEGSDQLFTIAAHSGYQIADVLVDGSSVGAVSEYTFYGVDEDHTIAASFELLPLLVDSTFDASTDNATLRENGAGQDWYESRNHVPTLLYLDTTNVGGNTGKKAGFTASESGNAYLTQEFSTPQTGTFSVQWDIYVDSILKGSLSTYRAAQMMIGDNHNVNTGYESPNYPSAERFVYMAFYKSGGGTSGTMDLVAPGKTTIATGLNLNQWYTIRVIVNVPAGTYDVYVNGVFMKTVTANSARTSLTHISFAQWDDGAGAFFVDNVFSPPVDRYKLTVTTVGEGTVSRDIGESSYLPGTVVELTAVPADGWSFSGWSGALTGTDNPATITMDNDKTVTATFTAAVSWTISASAGPGGSIDPVGDVIVAEGADQNFTISPDAGYQVLDVLVDGSSVGAILEYTFFAVSADHTIEASFELVPLIVDSEFNDSLDSNDLRNNTAGQDWYESRNHAGYQTLLYLDESDVGGNTGKKAGFTASASGNAYLTQEFSSPQTGTFTVQWDIYVDSILNKAPYRAGQMMIGSTSASYGPNRHDSVRFVFLAFYKDGGATSGTADLVSMTAFGTFTTVAADLNLHQWYTIRVIVNVTAKNYEVYVDGVYRGTYPAVAVWAQPSITHISFAQWDDGAGAFYIDNVFSPAVDRHKLVVDVVGDGTVEIDPGESTYAQGANVTLTAIPAEGWIFFEWTGDLTGDDNPATITITANMNITAHFTLKQYTINATVTGIGGTIDPSGLITVYHGQNQTFTITPDLGYHILDVIVDDESQDPISTYTFYTVTSNHTITATFARTEYTLTIVRSPEEGGTVYMNHTGPYYYGDIVELTANPTAGWAFTGWSGDITSTETTITITMDSNKSITATFTQNEYTLTVTASPEEGGTINLNKTAPYYYGDTVELEAIPAPGWTFSHWTGNLTGSLNPTTIIIDGNKTVTAVFTQDQYYLYIDTEGSGNVTKLPDQVSYSWGTNVTLTAVANPGWTFSHWTGDFSSIDNPTTINMTQNMSITAWFTQDHYTLNITVVGDGSVTADPDQPTYTYGQTVNPTATANTGWIFTSWTGDITSTENPATITMTQNTSVTATFTRIEYSLTINIEGSGQVSRNDTGPYYHGSVIELTAIPDLGWTFTAWSGDLTGTDNPATIIMDENKTVTATFNRDEYALTVTVSPEATGTVILNNTGPIYYYGDTVQLEAIPEPGWSFSHWTGDLEGSLNPTTILIDGNKTVTAIFAQDQYSLAISIEGSGTVTKQPDQASYSHGTNVTLTAIANAGWRFAHWTGDLEGTENPATINMTQNMSVTAVFTQEHYTLTVYVHPEGSGSVSLNHTGPYYYGDAVNLTATPETGYLFSEWTGDLSGTDNPATIIMNGNKTVTAIFTEAAVNTPPEARDLTISPESPFTTDDLLGNYTYFDADGDSEDGTEITWYKDGVLQPELNNTLVVPSSLTLKGEVWHFTVKPKDGTDFGTEVQSPEVTIQNSPPAITSYSPPADPTIAEGETQEFSITHSDPDNDPVTVQWYQNGAPTTTTDSYIFTAEAGSAGTYNITVVVSDTSAQTRHQWNLTVTTDNTPPVAANLLIVPSSPYTSNDLFAIYDYYDADGDPESGTEIRWYKNDILQPELNNTLIVPSSSTAKAEVWHFTVKPKDGQHFGTLQTSPSVTVRNTAPSITSVELSPDPAYTTSTLTATPVGWLDPDDDPENYRYQWQKLDNGVWRSIPGETSNTLASHHFVKGDQIRIICIPYDGEAYGTLQQAAITISNSPPTINTFTPPTTPNPEVNEADSLEFTHTSTDPDNDPLQYTWLLNHAEVANTQNWTYTPDYDAAGHHNVTLTVTDGQLSASIQWNITVIDVNRAPIIETYTPQDLTPTVNEGETLNFTHTSHDPDGDPVTYHWLLDGIEQATTQNWTYPPSYDEAGYHNVTLIVSDGHLTASVQWNVTVINVNRPPEITFYFPTEPELEINEGQTIEFMHVSTDPDGDPLTYKWLLNHNEQATSQNWTFTTNYESAGFYNVTLAVTDGELTATIQWNVTVINVNRPPQIDSYYPPEDPEILEGETQEFNITCSDLDGDDLLIQWYLDNIEDGITNSTSYTFTAPPDSAGTYAIAVQVSDGIAEVWQNWTLTVTSTTQYTLDMTIIGQGTVDKNPDQETYTEGTTVTLTANPQQGWQFSGWSGDLTGTETPANITMDQNKTVTATFTQIPLLTDSEFNDSSSSADLRAKGDEGWYESRNDDPTLLYLDESDVGGNTGKKAGFTASETKNAYLTQNFSSPQTGVFSVQWDIYVDSILDKSPHRAGQMMIGRDGGSGPNRNTADRFVYMAFSKPGGGTSGTMDLVAPGKITVATNLNLNQWYTIKVVVNVPAGTYDVYVDGVFKATVNANAALVTLTHISFAQWDDGAGAFYVDNVFSPAVDRYKLTVTVDGSGTVNVDPGESSYANGTMVSLVPTADLGYIFDHWKLDGAADGSDVPYLVTMDTHHTVTAVFKPEANVAPVVSNIEPADAATNVPITTSQLNFTLTDENADPMDYYISTTPNIGSANASGVSDGVYSLAVSGLTPGTKYTWWINVTDGTLWTNMSYTFTTQPPLLVDSEFNDSVDSDDLRANSEGQDWYESRAQVPTLLYLDETDVGGNTGKKAGFTASASGNAYLTQEFASAQTGTFSVQWDIYVESILDISASKGPDRAGIMMLGTSSGSTGPNRADSVRFVFLAFYKDGGATSGTADLVSMTAFGTFTTVAADLNLHQWYTIRVIVNVTAKNYEVYVDGVYRGTYPAVAVWAQPSITHISFAQWDDGAGAFYVDNVFSPVVDRYKLTVTVDGSGAVEADPGESTYAQRTNVTLTAVPADGWTFSHWTGNLTGSENPILIIMDNHKTITATFTPLPLLVDSEFNDSLDSNDLRNNTAGQDWYESRNAVPSTMLYLDEANIGGNTGKKAGFAGNTAQNAYMSQEFSSAQTGTFSVQWDIYVDSINSSHSQSGFMFIGDNSAGDLNTDGSDKGPNSAIAERFMYMYFYKNGGGTTGTMQLRIRQSNPSAITTIATLNLDQWYTIKVVCNLDSDTILVYVDGAEYGPYRAYTYKTSVTHISFATWDDGPGVFYVDNVYSPARDTYKLTVNTDGHGSVTVDPGESSYLFGTAVSLTPVADSGYVFDHWEIDGETYYDVPYLITMDSDKVITAFFRPE